MQLTSRTRCCLSTAESEQPSSTQIPSPPEITHTELSPERVCVRCLRAGNRCVAKSIRFQIDDVAVGRASIPIRVANTIFQPIEMYTVGLTSFVKKPDSAHQDKFTRPVIDTSRWMDEKHFFRPTHRFSFFSTNSCTLHQSFQVQQHNSVSSTAFGASTR